MSNFFGKEQELKLTQSIANFASIHVLIKVAFQKKMTRRLSNYWRLGSNSGVRVSGLGGVRRGTEFSGRVGDSSGEAERANQKR